MSDFDGEMRALYTAAQEAHDRAAAARRRAALPPQPPRRRNAVRRRNREEKSQVARAAMRDAYLLAQSDFHGTATIQGLDDALSFAQMVCSTCAADTAQLVYWTDVSGGDGEASAGWSSAIKTPAGWNWRVGRHGSQGGEHSEMMAIEAALDMAVECVLERQRTPQGRPALVRVFSGCPTALRKIHRARHAAGWDPATPHPDVVETMEGIMRCSEELRDLGVRQELHWVPRGLVKGSRFADSTAEGAHMSPNRPIEAGAPQTPPAAAAPPASTAPASTAPASTSPAASASTGETEATLLARVSSTETPMAPAPAPAPRRRWHSRRLLRLRRLFARFGAR